jgi:hypothetical protein
MQGIVSSLQPEMGFGAHPFFIQWALWVAPMKFQSEEHNFNPYFKEL